MHLNSIREGELKEVFDAVEEAFTATGTDFYVIGALAKDIWYTKGSKIMRKTKDVDFAVLTGSQDDYDAVKHYLKKNKNFVDTKSNSFMMLTPSGVQVDILPFGEIEAVDNVSIAVEGLTTIKMNGLMEVYQSGTEKVEIATGHHFKIATLPSIVLLKLIAFDDRPEMRSKDARDIANIISHFFDLQADLIYEKHSDLFAGENDDQSLEEISATVIGRDIREICISNGLLIERLKTILLSHINLKVESLFIRNMVAETGGTVEKSVQLIQNIYSSLVE